MQSWAQYSDQALPEILYFDELYLAAPDGIRRNYIEHSGSSTSVLTIGHNPGMELLASELVGELIEMKTAHMVVFEREEDGEWRLVENIRGED
jgi:phosphohistidine phosphatase SixA